MKSFFLSLSLLLLTSTCLASRFELLDRFNQCQLDQINALEPDHRVESEAGLTETWNSRHPELQCAGVSLIRRTIDPKGLHLPSYSPAPQLILILQGKGVLGISVPGCPDTYEEPQQSSRSHSSSPREQQERRDRHQKIRRFYKGDIIAIPPGTPYWTYNHGNEPLIAISLLDTSNFNNQLDSTPRVFYLGGSPDVEFPETQQQQQEQEEEQGRRQRRHNPGGRRGGQHQQKGEEEGQEQEQEQENEGGSVLSGFSSEFLAQALNTDKDTAKRLQSPQDERKQIVKVEEGLQHIISPDEEDEEDEDQQESRRRSHRRHGEDEEDEPRRRSHRRQEDEDEDEDEDEEEQGPRRQQRQSQKGRRSHRREEDEDEDDDEEEDRHSRRHGQREEDEEEQRPARHRRSQDEDEDEDEEDEPSSKKSHRWSRRHQKRQPSRRGGDEEEEEEEEEEEQEQEERRTERHSRKSRGHDSNGIEETICTAKLRENIARPSRADLYNPRAGRISTVNSLTLPILRHLRLGAEYVVLYKNGIYAPHWTINANSLLYVIRGRGRVQIVNCQGNSVFDDEVRRGQLLVVPQNFVVAQQAGDEGLEYVVFKTNDRAAVSHIKQVFRATPAEVLQNAFGLRQREVTEIKFSGNRGPLVHPQSQPRSRSHSRVIA